MQTRIYADFSERVVIHTPDQEWQTSPSAGVERRPLDRIGGEKARATSVVRYAPGSRFEQHSHDGGEEILVLEGVFSDETGDYPAGTYIRNPPGSAHAPRSEAGAVIFVKLRQFQAADTERVVIDTRSAGWSRGLVPGLSVQPLHNFAGEGVALVHWQPDTVFQPHTHPGGEEIFVLDGVFRDEQGDYPKGTWLRNPPWSSHHPYTREEGALIYVKTGHLAGEATVPA